jgi:hypothetical protein
MTSPPKQMAARDADLGGHGKTVLGRSGNPNNTAVSPVAQVEQPPQFRSRRTFIVWAVSFGFCSEKRLTEAIVSELQREAVL